MSNIDFVLLPFLHIVVVKVIETSQFPLHLLAHILCISFFSAQMYGLVEHLVAPKMTHIHVREVPLKDIDFPREFKICVSPSMNSTVLNEFGYDGNIDGSYVAGISSRTNYSSVGFGRSWSWSWSQRYKLNQCHRGFQQGNTKCDKKPPTYNM